MVLIVRLSSDKGSFFLLGEFMRYHYEKSPIYLKMYGKTLFLSHSVYSRCTLYTSGNKGLAVIQQRFDENTKKTWWTEIDPWLVDDLYLNDSFKAYFDEHAEECTDGMKPIPK